MCKYKGHCLDSRIRWRIINTSRYRWWTIILKPTVNWAMEKPICAEAVKSQTIYVQTWLLDMSRKHSYNNVPETRQCKSSLLLGVYIYRVPVSTQAVFPVVFVRLVIDFVPDAWSVETSSTSYRTLKNTVMHRYVYTIQALMCDNKWMK